MPKVIQTGQSVTITTLKLVATTYAYEDSGDPPVSTLREIHTYELVDAAGKVYERRSVGRAVPADRLAAAQANWTKDQADLTTAEGI